MAWTKEEEEFLAENYPEKGKQWCMHAMNKSEASIRAKAARLGLRQDRESDFFRNWQERAASSKIGKRRPDQALVMKRLHAEGKLIFGPERRVKQGLITKKFIAENGHPRGSLGLKHSDSAKKKIAEASSKTWQSLTDEQKSARNLKMMKTREANGTMISPRLKQTWKAGWREIGEVSKYYRSRWEANYARYLEWLKQRGEIEDWKHEPKTFWFEGVKRGSVSYLPDFWVKEANGKEAYHEVKGWMDDRSKTKIKRMAKYHPDIKLIVIDAKSYKAIQKSISMLVPGWE